MNIKLIIESALYFLSLINPASKVFLLSSMEPQYTWREIKTISIRSTIVAFLILCVLTTIGSFLLKTVFHVEIYSLQIAGGIILFIIGLTAVRVGRFFEMKLREKAHDISVVPLGAPLIAGPGTITASIAFSSTNGVSVTMLALSIALLINFIIMLWSLWIGKVLERLHVTGPLIRITGLIVAAVAVQMILNGMEEWLRKILA